jgi:hypothetical protein
MTASEYHARYKEIWNAHYMGQTTIEETKQILYDLGLKYFVNQKREVMGHDLQTLSESTSYRL